MPQTIVGLGDPKAVKRWSGDLAVDIRKKSYFEQRFIGTSPNSIIQRRDELTNEAGDTISYDLSVPLRNKPTYGDNRLEGNEEQLVLYSDQVSIDQVRHAVSAGGKMSRKRTLHNMRVIARDRLGDYFYKLLDELLFIYLSGARGINADFIESPDFTGFANNALETPDTDHMMYGGVATSKATLSAADTMSVALVEKAQEKAAMMQAENPQTSNMVPVNVEGEDRFVIVMSKYSETDLRRSTNSASEWLDIQRAAAAAEGKNNPIFKGGLGMINNTVLHSHRNCIRFSDYGAGSNVAASRALFLGRQAGVIAYGTTAGMRWDWSEVEKDHGNEASISASGMVGIKKARFNNTDFGVLSIDVAAQKHA